MQKRLNHLILFIVSFACFQTVESQTLPDYLPSNGLVAWYPFNGNANDESGNGNDFVNPNFSFSTNADLDSSANLKGTLNESVVIPELCSKDVEHSFSFSFSYFGNDAFDIFLQSENDELISINISSRHVIFQFSGEETSFFDLPIRLNSNDWNHVTIVRNELEEVFFYFNALEDISSDVLSNPNIFGPFYWRSSATPCAFFFNNISFPSCGYFYYLFDENDVYSSNLYIDNVAMYKTALSSEEVVAIHSERPVSIARIISTLEESSTPLDAGDNDEKVLSTLVFEDEEDLKMNSLIPFQLLLTNARGKVLANKEVSVRFTIHKITIDGDVEYQEVQHLNSDNRGVLSGVIGNGIPVFGSTKEMNWFDMNKFLQVEVDMGKGYLDRGTQKLMFEKDFR